jgi:hypothetical protein
MLATLTFRNGIITGFLSGKPLHCFLAAPPGWAPPPGEYRIEAPVDDLIYGPVAIVRPSNLRFDPGITQDVIRRLPELICRSLPTAIGSRPPSGSVGQMSKTALPPDGGPAFVLTSRPISSRNCLAVTIGASEIFSALRSAGGATITAP